VADTLTSKGITLFDPALNYDVTKFNTNFQKLSDGLGSVICTSGTRPSTGLYDGMTLWETDTRRFVVRVSSAWIVVASRTIVADFAARAAITTPYDGMMVWRQDTDWNEVYDGAAWRVVGVAHCASTAVRDTVITNPYNGQLCITTDTGTVWQRVAGSWTSAVNRLIAFSERITPSAGVAGSSAMGVRRLDSVVMKLGCAYRIYTGTLHPTSTVSTDNLRVEIRYNNAGLSSASSTLLPGALAFEAFGNTTSLNAFYVPAANETVSFALCVARDTGSGSASLYADTSRRTQLFVEECPLVANTGVNM
jgi:hypothetical protein